MSQANHATYKRDQVEQAIAIASGLQPQQEPKRFATLKIELKRLLDQDRKQAPREGLGLSGKQAFHSAPPPGRGVDVFYSRDEAFSLLVGLRLLRGGLPQATVITFIRDLRGPLHVFLADTLKRSAEEIRPDLAPTTRVNRTSSGVLVDDPKKMVYLVALSGDHAEAFEIPRYPNREVTGNICHRVDDLLHRLRWASHEGHALIVVELVNAAHQLAHHLDRIEPRSRGRQ